MPAQQEMRPRPASSNNGQWTPTQNRRPGEHPAVVPTRSHDTPSPQEIARLSERLAEMERALNASRRQNIGTQLPVHAANISIPAHGPAPVNFQPPTSGHTQMNSVFPPPAIPHNISGATMQGYGPPGGGTGAPPPRQYTGPMPLVPPPPYIDDIFRDFSLCSPQDYFVHEARLYQRINFQAKIRLGYGKAISVLQRELDNSLEYERITRPYQIDQPDNLPLLSPLIPNSEARLFADTVRALVDIIGLQRACHLLENAKLEEIPGIRYEIQRVTIPSRVGPIPLEPESNSMPPNMAEIGPFARPRSDSVASATSSVPTMYSWSPAPMTMSPPAPPQPTSIGIEDIPSEDILPPPAIPPPVGPQRGILRRTSSGSSFNGKRVTIQTDHDCHCASHYGSSTSSSFESVMSPVSMSPIKVEGVPLDLTTEFQHRGMQSRITEFKSIKPEDGVLQQMAAAQM